MKICMPVEQINGLDSEIAPNFRAAPALLVIDSVSGECLGIDAANGSCSATPHHLDVIVCAGGIGRGMFNGLRSRGVRVFNTESMTVRDALAELAAGSLPEVTEVDCCGGGQHSHARASADDPREHEAGHSCGCSSAHGESVGCCQH
jgi:predicted Fe-Mo cluster-binding NifX family protein